MEPRGLFRCVFLKFQNSKFDEFAALIAKVQRYKASQLLPMQAMKGAVSSDAPTMFKLRGGAVLDRELGPNFPVRYTPDPQYKVRTPAEVSPGPGSRVFSRTAGEELA